MSKTSTSSLQSSRIWCCWTSRPSRLLSTVIITNMLTLVCNPLPASLLASPSPHSSSATARSLSTSPPLNSTKFVNLIEVKSLACSYPSICGYYSLGINPSLSQIRSAFIPYLKVLSLFFCFVFFFFFLFCFVLFCFVLFCFVLFCFVLFCFVLLCFALLCFVLLCFALLCFALLCFALHCILISFHS